MFQRLAVWLVIGGFVLGQPGIVLAEDALAIIAPEGQPTESAEIPLQKALMEGTTPTIPQEAAVAVAAMNAENTTNVEQLTSNTSAQVGERDPLRSIPSSSVPELVERLEILFHRVASTLTEFAVGNWRPESRIQYLTEILDELGGHAERFQQNEIAMNRIRSLSRYALAAARVAIAGSLDQPANENWQISPEVLRAFLRSVITLIRTIADALPEQPPADPNPWLLETVPAPLEEPPVEGSLVSAKAADETTPVIFVEEPPVGEGQIPPWWDGEPDEPWNRGTITQTRDHMEERRTLMRTLMRTLINDPTRSVQFRMNALNSYLANVLEIFSE